MKKDLAEFKEFLTWFCGLEDIPLETRRDFLAHMLKVGKIDAKSRKFVDDTLEALGAKYQKEIDEYQALSDSVSGIMAARHFPGSMEDNIVTSSSEYMMELATDYKEEYVANELLNSERAERAEEAGSGAEIERLKAGVA